MTIRSRGRRLVTRLESLEKYFHVPHPDGILLYWVDEDGSESDHIFIPPPPRGKKRRQAEDED